MLAHAFHEVAGSTDKVFAGLRDAGQGNSGSITFTLEHLLDAGLELDELPQAALNDGAISKVDLEAHCRHLAEQAWLAADQM